MLIKPECVHFGDTVGIVAPASAPVDPASIDRSVAGLERLGFKPKLAPHARERLGFLAGPDRDRAGDLMRMFTDRKIKAIICLRGGYGAARLLPLLDYRTIRAHPKILVGYSDITSLHCALLVKAKLVSFHGPVLNSDFIGEKAPEFTHQSFLRTLTQTAAPGSISRGYQAKTAAILWPGKVSGLLIGGNLSILCSTLGTPYQPNFKKAILFFEEVGEPPYRFDRMLTHLLNAGLLQQIAGIAVGINLKCLDPRSSQTQEYRQTVEEVLKERLLPLKIPIVSGLPFGHIPHVATLPIGVRATLDAEAGDLSIIESAVVER